MEFVDWFAGVGGFRKGLEQAGHKCIGFCEFDKYAVASYTAMHLITEEQRKHIESLPKRERQKEILKEEYKNGEWYAADIREVRGGAIPKADCWTFGAPCQDFSLAGKRRGLQGDRSSLIREVFRLLEEQKEEERPTWLIYENVKGMLYSNRGLDYLQILSEMDRLGYDIEWQNINSRWYVPQNRERIYTIGYLRKARTSRKQILPIQGASGKNHIKQIVGGCQGNRILQDSGISCTLTGHGGGQGAKTGLYTIPIDCIDSGYQGVQGTSKVYQEQAPTLLSRDYKEPKKIAVPVITPERKEKRQNGRRLKENQEPTHTLTAQDRHGVMVKVGEQEVYATWYEKYNCYVGIRRLTPRECFRLQGWSDEYFERAEQINSDTQLYIQAGNGVTVPVVYEIGKRMEV